MLPESLHEMRKWAAALFAVAIGTVLAAVLVGGWLVSGLWAGGLCLAAGGEFCRRESLPARTPRELIAEELEIPRRYVRTEKLERGLRISVKLPARDRDHKLPPQKKLDEICDEAARITGYQVAEVRRLGAREFTVDLERR